MNLHLLQKIRYHHQWQGVAAALGAAVLFGAGTPIAKILLATVSPWMLAGLLYLGSGVGLTLYRLMTRAPAVRLPAGEAIWFGGAILCGGVIAPVLLMAGLTRMPASGASLLLNAESVFTAVLAWVAFRENVDHRIIIGMLFIVAGAAVLSWPGEVEFAAIWPSLAVLGACLCWGIDNNLTRKVSLHDEAWIASVKGLAAGSVNMLLALLLHDRLPTPTVAAAAMLVGFLAYGVSLALFVVGLRHLGTARTGAYFSVAPFVGAVLSLAMGEPVTTSLLAGGVLMAAGIWLHLTEHHVHWHTHDVMEHEHEHTHDEHHQHEHEDGITVTPGKPHRHWHRHEPLTHQHAHYPDAHHQHSH
jgi:drug/metabolite transporter (DMT)-like permease